MNKRGLSRMLSVLLLVVMVVSMLPVSAYAEGATATLVTDASTLKAGDKIIIVTYAQMKEDEIKTHKPTIVQVGENNEIISYGRK